MAPGGGDRVCLQGLHGSYPGSCRGNSQLRAKAWPTYITPKPLEFQLKPRSCLVFWFLNRDAWHNFFTGLSFWILKLPTVRFGWYWLGGDWYQQNYSPGRSPECHRRTRTDPRLWIALTESSSFLRWTSTYKCTKGWGSIPWPHRHKKCLTLGNA